MLTIAIVEDEPRAAERLAESARAWGRARRLEFAVRTFASAEQLLFAIGGTDGSEGPAESGDHVDPGAAAPDVALLDIEMPGMNGMELARRLRGSQIVFVTGIVDYVLEGYEVDAVAYLLKPVRDNKLAQALDRAVARIGAEKPSVLVEGRRVDVGDIVCVEARGHVAEVKLEDGTSLASRDGFTALKGELAKKTPLFVQAHRSYLVNVSHVRRITHAEVELDAGLCAPIARGRFDVVSDAWMAWMRGEAR